MKPRSIYEEPEVRRKEKREFSKIIGEHLRKIREKKGISQERLSREAGYYHTYVNKIEKGNYSPSLHTIWRLAYTLGMSLSEFFRRFS